MKVSVLLILLTVSLPLTATETDTLMDACIQQLSGLAKGSLLGISVAGRGTGRRLPAFARDLGFHRLHYHPKNLRDSVIRSFPHEDFSFSSVDHGPHSEDLYRVAGVVRDLSEKENLRVAGFMAGMDYGVPGADALANFFRTPSNAASSNYWRTDKGLLNDVLAERGVPVVRSISIEPRELIEQADRLTYPLFVKPSRSSASIGAGHFSNAAELKAGLRLLIEEANRMKVDSNRLVVQEVMNRSQIYFVDSINFVHEGQQRRIVTGIWLDSRGNDFPQEVWDYIVMFPPPAANRMDDDSLFNQLLLANDKVLTASEVQTGSVHLEFMAPSKDIHQPSDLKPTDLNLRLPGLNTPALETRATGLNPYILDIASRTFPEVLNDLPAIYTDFSEHVALVFLRASRDGIVRPELTQWISSLKARRREPGKAYVVESEFKTGEVKKTINGDSMLGVLHVVGPSHQAIEALYQEVREKERALFFLQ